MVPKRSSDDSRISRPKQGQPKAGLAASPIVQEIKEKLLDIQEAWTHQISWNAISEENIANLEKDINDILSKIYNFRDIDEIISLLLDLKIKIATLLTLCPIPKRNKKSAEEYFKTYKELIQLIEQLIKKLP